MLRRKTTNAKGESRKNFAFAVCLMAVGAFAASAPKSAGDYYGDAAFQYIENRLPTAEITCNEGLQYYPNDPQLQMLLERIREAKDQQKNENKKNDPKNDQDKDQNQEQNQDKDQNQERQDKEQNPQDKEQQDNQSGESSSSSENQNEENNPNPQNGDGQSSSSQGQSSDSGAGEQPEEVPAQLSPEEASQLLKDFDEQNGERKPWKPVRGQARPLKDW